MKSINYITFLIILLLLSCENILDRAPLDKVSEGIVWNDEIMVKAYVTNLYSRIPFNNALAQYNLWWCWTDEGTESSGNSNAVALGTVNKTSETNPFWDYAYIRDCNVLIDKMKTSTLSQSAKNQFEGEARFMRAFAYFEMMKRYGGVPLVDAVINPFEPIDEKYQVRATEEAIANFINEDLTTAIGLLSDNATPKGSINKWTANALNARAMLWAASIAKYGTVQLNGLVGIPAAQANSFYSKASAAADVVINSGKYSLYNATPSDKSENYRNIFLDESNSEVIFEKPYDGVNVAHSWDGWQAPNSWISRGELGNPTLDFILGYENIDGSTTQPTFGPGQLYTDGYAPFVNKDPRLRATVFFEGETFPNGKTIATYSGLDPSLTPDPTKIIYSSSVVYNGKVASGVDSRTYLDSDAKTTNSGFIIKKFTITTQLNIQENQSWTNWIALRLAEMYLIKAEAEFEMGNIAPAVTALNMTRNRAGISLVNAASITRDKIRTERRSELAFECHEWWDLRRWRTAISVLNYRFKGLDIIYHSASGKYYFIPFNCETFTRSFKQEHYYNPITSARINNNPKLVENPLY